MNKPNLEKVLSIIEKKKLAIELLNEVEIEITSLIKVFGENRFDYVVKPILNDTGKECNYLKFELIDNASKLNRGEKVFASTIFKKSTFISQFLIRKPVSLKTQKLIGREDNDDGSGHGGAF